MSTLGKTYRRRDCGPWTPERLAKRRATAAGKPHGFALWPVEKRRQVQAMGHAARAAQRRAETT